MEALYSASIVQPDYPSLLSDTSVQGWGLLPPVTAHIKYGPSCYSRLFI